MSPSTLTASAARARPAPIDSARSAPGGAVFQLLRGAVGEDDLHRARMLVVRARTNVCSIAAARVRVRAHLRGPDARCRLRPKATARGRAPQGRDHENDDDGRAGDRRRRAGADRAGLCEIRTPPTSAPILRAPREREGADARRAADAPHRAPHPGARARRSRRPRAPRRICRRSPPASPAATRRPTPATASTASTSSTCRRGRAWAAPASPRTPPRPSRTAAPRSSTRARAPRPGPSAASRDACDTLVMGPDPAQACH